MTHQNAIYCLYALIKKENLEIESWPAEVRSEETQLSSFLIPTF